MDWYNKVSQDLGEIPNFLNYYENELSLARSEIKIYGNLEKNLSALPGITELRFNQLQDIEAILEYMNIQLKKLRRKYFQQYLEAYQRELSSRDAEKYADGETEVVEYEVLMNAIALIRNKYLGIMKGLECKNYMISNVVRLRVVGMENAVL